MHQTCRNILCEFYSFISCNLDIFNIIFQFKNLWRLKKKRLNGGHINFIGVAKKNQRLKVLAVCLSMWSVCCPCVCVSFLRVRFLPLFKDMHN